MKKKLIGICIILLLILSSCNLVPIGGGWKCTKYCNQEYSHKTQLGAFGSWINNYKCGNKTLIEDTLNHCQDKEGYWSECTTYSCSDNN